MLKEFLVTFKDASGIIFEQYKTLDALNKLKAENKVIHARKLTVGEVLELAQFECDLFGF